MFSQRKTHHNGFLTVKVTGSDVNDVTYTNEHVFVSLFDVFATRPAQRCQTKKFVM